MRQNKSKVAVVVPDMHLGYDPYPGHPRTQAFLNIAEEIAGIEKDYIVFLGDIFHSKYLRGSDVDLAIKGILKMKGNATGYILVGNHDIEAKEKLTISFLGRDLEVVSKPLICEWEGFGDVLLLPYFTKIPDLAEVMREWKRKTPVDLMFTHYFISSMIDFPSKDETLDFKEVNRWTGICISGHYHKFKVSQDKRVYTGTLIPVSFADERIEGVYFKIISASGKAQVEVHSSGAPVFLDLRKGRPVHSIPSSKLIIRAVEGCEELKQIPKEQIAMLQLFPPLSISKEVEKVLSKTAEDRKRLASSDVFTGFEEYVSSVLKSLPDTLKTDVITKGKDYLTRAMQEVVK